MEVKTLARDHTANKWQSRNPNPVRLAVEPTRCPHTTPILSGLSSLGRGAERCCRSPKVTQQVRGSREAVAQASPTPKVHPGSAWSLRTSGHRPRKSGNLLFSIPQSLIPSPTPSFVGLEMGNRGLFCLFCPFTQWWGALTPRGWSERRIKNQNSGSSPCVPLLTLVKSLICGVMSALLASQGS